jgi:hypothetical protein
VKIRFYFDEDSMDGDLAESLRARGVDVETAYEAGMLERGDHEQLSYAAAQGRVMFTFNVKHFSRLHGELLAGGGNHAGIVVCSQQRYTIGEEMRRLLQMVAAKTAEEMRDQLEFLSGWG